MAEQTQLQQVTMKDPKKVEVGKILSEFNHRKREELAQLVKGQSEPKLHARACGKNVSGDPALKR